MKKAHINQKKCVACGVCVQCCPKTAIRIEHGVFAAAEEKLCVGCGLCARSCPALLITVD